MEKRKTGYYWVRVNEDSFWSIAWFGAQSETWSKIGISINVDDGYFFEVNKNRIVEP